MTPRTTLLLSCLFYLLGHTVSAANDGWISIPPEDIGASATPGLYVYVKKGTAESDSFRVLDTFNRTYVGSNWAADSRYWKIENDEFVLTEAAWKAWKYMAIFKPVATDEDYRIVRVGHVWGDSATYEGTPEGALAVMANEASTRADAYWLWHRNNWRQVWLWEILNGEYDSEDGEERMIEQVRASAPSTKAGDKIYATISEDPDENVFRYYINGQYDGKLTDPDKRFSTGRPWYVGLFMRGENTQNDVDDFEIVFTGPRYDTTPPAQVSDINATEINANSVTLSWTASGDNGFEGTPSSVDFRYSLSPISQENFNAALQPETQPELLSGGSPVSLYLDYLIADTTYYFALKYSDPFGNESLLSREYSCETGVINQPAEIIALSNTPAIGTVHQDLQPPLEFRIVDQAGMPIANARVRFVPAQNDTLGGEKTLLEAEESLFSFPFFRLSDSSAGHGQSLGVYESDFSENELAYTFTKKSANKSNIWLRFRQKQARNEHISIALNGAQLPDWELQMSENFTGGWHWRQIGTIQNTHIPAGDSLFTFQLALQNISTNILLDQIQLMPENQIPADGVATSTDEQLSDQSGLVWFTPNLPTRSGTYTYHVQTYDANVQSSITVEAIADTPAFLTLLTGENQTGYIGNTLTTPFVVRVQDQFENPVAGIPVHFMTSVADANILPSALIQTDSQGIASAYFQLGQVPGPCTLTFSVEALPDTIFETSATAIKRIPTQLLIISGDSQNTPATQQTHETLVAQVVDSAGIGVQGIHLQWSIPDSAATIAGRSVFIDTTDTQGLASISPWMGPRAGPVRIEVKPYFEYADQFPGVAFHLRAIPLAPFAGIRLDDSLLVGSFGKMLPQPVRVQLIDSLGNTIPEAGHAATFEVVTGRGKFSNDTSSFTAESDSSGIVQTFIKAPTSYLEPSTIQLKTGSRILTRWTVYTAAPTRMMLHQGNNQQALVKTALDISPGILIADSLGAPAPDVVVVFQIANGGGCFTDSSTTRSVKTDSLGHAKCTWILGDSVGIDSQQLSASAMFNDAHLENSPIIFTASAISNQQTINLPPQILSPDTLYFTENELTSYVIRAQDPEADPVAFSATGFPKNTILLQGDSLKIYWKPDYTQAGTYHANLRVQDAFKNASDTTIILSVQNVNRPPQIESYSPQTSSITLGTSEQHVFSINAGDADDDSLFFAWFSESESDTVFLASTDSLRFFAQDILPQHIRGVVSDGTDSVSVIWRIEQKNTGIASERLPTAFYLSRGMPNPFDRSFVNKIKFTAGLPNAMHIKLLVFNTLGQHVATIADDHTAGGLYTYFWDGQDKSGVQVPQGVYFVILIGDGIKSVQKIILLN